jgi:hypothetical protein
MALGSFRIEYLVDVDPVAHAVGQRERAPAVSGLDLEAKIPAALAFNVELDGALRIDF